MKFFKNSLLVFSSVFIINLYAAVDIISVEDAYEMYQIEIDNSNFHTIDVRMSFEYSEKHIFGAENIDFIGGSFSKEIEQYSRSDIFLIYCASGTRGKGAMKEMATLGFFNVYNIDGGLSSWVNNSYPVEN